MAISKSIAHALSLSATMALGVLLTACSSSNDDITPSSSEKGEGTINFVVTNYEQINIDSLAATRSVAATALDTLVLAVYDAETHELVQEIIKQSSNDDSYATFSLTLPYGDYVIVCVGYNGNGNTINMDDPTNISFSQLGLLDFHSKTLWVTVDDDTSSTQSLVLSRRVASFAVIFTDTIPNDYYYIRFTYGTCYRTYNAITDCAATATSGYVREVDQHTKVGVTGHKISMYFFLPEEEGSLDNVLVEALDVDKNVLASHTFTNVPMKINQMTQYSGNFFTTEEATSEFSVSLETITWNYVNYTF